MQFNLKSNYQPAGDQPKAIKQLVDGLHKGNQAQTLLGVTGSGKTFTMANVIQQVQRPTLVIAHNKTLAAQLCNEFREFFPDNAVEYFVSYYDYYQPEAYMPRSDTYIEKEAMINEEIDRLRHAATQALLSRRDTIIVASVSCIYNLGSPKEYERSVLHLSKRRGSGYQGPGAESKIDSSNRRQSVPGPGPLSRSELFRQLIEMQFERTNADLKHGSFRSHGDVIEVMPVNLEIVYRLMMDGDDVTDIQELDHVTRKKIRDLEDIWLFPAKHYVVSRPRQEEAIKSIRRELNERLAEFDKAGSVLEAERLSRRTRYDLELIEQVGFCNGIENYSRYFDGRAPGESPQTLMHYFPDDFLTFIDESHVTIPQIGGMYNGDQARKATLIEHGFRLPSAKDNRPMNFEEFEKKIGQVVYVSATPSVYERARSEQVVEQIIRPTGLVDPEVEVRPITSSSVDPYKNSVILSASEGSLQRTRDPSSKTPQDDTGYPGQVEDLIKEVVVRAKKSERSLITTLTKKMAEDLTEFLLEKKIKVQYLHSGVDTLDRITILSDLRKGTYDAIVGVNLLREGLDLPEVTLVAILDADKEGFLRSETSIIQTIGRAARNVDGRVILYADHMTSSLTRALKETDRRRKIQVAYNKEHGITPTSIHKAINDIRGMLSGETDKSIEGILKLELTADPHELEQVIKEKEHDMREAAKKLDFETAALLRDEIGVLAKELKEKSKKKKIITVSS